MKYGDALTPEEWRARATASHGGADRAAFREAPDGFPISDPIAFVREDGTLGVDNSGGEYGCPELDARKIMALANLSLTLQAKSEAITLAHVEVCISAAWYYRKLSRELKDTAAKLEDAEQREQFLQHANALTQGNTRLLALADLLRALVPPQ